jgi:hypothetical protein
MFFIKSGVTPMSTVEYLIQWTCRTEFKYRIGPALQWRDIQALKLVIFLCCLAACVASR